LKPEDALGRADLKANRDDRRAAHHDGPRKALFLDANEWLCAMKTDACTRVWRESARSISTPRVSWSTR